MEKLKWLVAADLDGTLIPYNQSSSKELPDDVMPELLHLQSIGVGFCAASGRPIEPLHTMFGELGEDCWYLAENASWVYEGSRLLQINPLPAESCKRIAAAVTPRTDCVLRVNTTLHKYFLVQEEAVLEYLRTWKYADRVPVLSISDFSQVEGDITQMTVISFGEVMPIARDLAAVETPDLKRAITGKYWLDFSAADKGTGIGCLCRHLNLPRERVLAFGDYYNDVPMLDVAGHPYIMAQSTPELLKKYPNHCENVVTTLRELEAAGFFDR